MIFNWLFSLKPGFISSNTLKNLLLGELQISFSTLTQNLGDYIFYENKKELGSKIRALGKQIRLLEDMNDSKRQQEEKLEEEIEIVKKEVKRLKYMVDEKIGKVMDLESAEAKLVNLERQLAGLPTEILNNITR